MIDTTEPEEPMPPEPELELRIDRVEILVEFGKWRGKNSVGAVAPQSQTGSWRVFAKDDKQPYPWGRAVEEVLNDLFQGAINGGALQGRPANPRLPIVEEGGASAGSGAGGSEPPAS